MGATAKPLGLEANRIRGSEDLESSLRTINSPTAEDAYAMLSAAEFAVSCGRCDEADLGLRRAEDLLRRRGVRFSSMDALRHVSHRLRQAGIDRRVRQLGGLGKQLFSRSDDAVLSVAPGARTLLVVFGSIYGNFWVSYPVLHCLLPSERVTILYLKDPAAQMFLAGLPHFGGGFDALCDGIRDVARDHAIDNIRIVGFSSGGFGSLLAALRLGAGSYLGLSIRTNLDPRSEIPNDRYVQRPDLRGAAGDLMCDLKPLLAVSEFPRRGVLYYGADSPIDAAHARHLEGVPRFTVNRIPDCKHNTMLKLIAEGKFEGLIRRLLS